MAFSALYKGQVRVSPVEFDAPHATYSEIECEVSPAMFDRLHGTITDVPNAMKDDYHYDYLAIVQNVLWPQTYGV